MISQSREKKKESPSLPPRERLLNSAAKLFYKEGVQATGIERLLSDADTAKASLYSNFGSKDALVTAYLEREAEGSRQKIEALMHAAGPDPRRRLLAMFEILSSSCAESGFRGCPFQNAAAEITDPAHPARGVIESQRAWLSSLVTGLVKQAGLKPQPLSDALLALYEGAVAGATVGPPGASARAARWAAERLLSDTR